MGVTIANEEAVEYLVKTMLAAGIKRKKILKVARRMTFLFGAQSELESEILAKKYLDLYDKSLRS